MYRYLSYQHAALQELSAVSAPEVRLGGSPSQSSDIYSLGMLILQLLTGSEATGLLEYTQRAMERGRLEDILDPCAEGISVSEASELASIALRYVFRWGPTKKHRKTRFCNHMSHINSRSGLPCSNKTFNNSLQPGLKSPPRTYEKHLPYVLVKVIGNSRYNATLSCSTPCSPPP